MYKKIIIRTLLTLLSLTLLLYISLWAISIKKYPITYGVSFSPEYAKYLGLDWKETYQAIINDLKPSYIRLAIPWSRVEEEKGVFSYDDIDYMMALALQQNVKVILTVGQKVPRWPECYIPEWAKTATNEERKQNTLSYLKQSVERYKDNPALEYWQVENEPFIKFSFGDCQAFDISTVQDEIDYVKSLDSSHPIVITDSGEISTWHTASKAGDVLGVTLYRSVRMPWGSVLNYVFIPPGYYKVRAYLWGKTSPNFFISELQAEPWFHTSSPANTSLDEQEETLNLEKFQEHLSFSSRIGASRAYFWGVEWWYWMKEIKGVPGYWEEGKKVLDN